MAKTKADERTFTKILYMARNSAGSYELRTKWRMLNWFCHYSMHRHFPGIWRLFPKPRGERRLGDKRRVRVTIEVLPNEPETPLRG